MTLVDVLYHSVLVWTVVRLFEARIHDSRTTRDAPERAPGPQAQLQLLVPALSVLQVVVLHLLLPSFTFSLILCNLVDCNSTLQLHTACAVRRHPSRCLVGRPLCPPGPPPNLRCLSDTLLCGCIRGDGCHHCGVRCGGACSEKGGQV